MATADGHAITDGVDNNIVGQYPLLFPLADYGGPTLTHALKDVSPCIDGGANPLSLTNDQRGSGFPCASGAVDMGAVEHVGSGSKAIKNPLERKPKRVGIKEFGGDLLSHTVARAVPSAQESLTSVFGMGTGGTSLLWPPKNQ